MTPWWYTASITLLLSLRATAWPHWSFKSASFQPPKLKITQTGPTEPGFIFLGPRGGGIQPAGEAPIIYDNNGNLVWEGPQEPVSNFKVQQLNGRDVITFWSGETIPLGFGYGSVHILDNTYQEINTVTLTGHFVTPDGSQKDSYIDLHESYITPSNTLLVTAYNLTQQDLTSIGGKPSEWIIDGQFYEIDIATNQVINSWSALEYQDSIPLNSSHQRLSHSAGTQANPYDAYHINSVSSTNHGYMVSLRHMWSGYYLASDGSVLWQVSGDDGGDFRQVGQTNFAWQHDIRLLNETDTGMILTLFNNANTPTWSEGPSTGLSLAIDLTQKTVTGLRSLIDPNDPIRSASQGNYQVLPDSDGHVLISYGSTPKIKEFDGDGNVVFNAAFGTSNTVSSYRAFRSKWGGTSVFKPALNVTRNSSGIVAYMSWNGVTDYDSWSVYSVSAFAIKFQIIGSANRTGFETSVPLGNLSTNSIWVAALQGGQIIGISDIVTF
ncbi:hypothetical protein N7493_006165 [Penicillium malachiteum]|uniref:ASST-domain-containing protein n=1 Tax=Penicillium malachiteum TaxID=1324776 RepID=A0AAD6HK95_9EURO|nr:hypothetical protein N7493_006165 [Penicillium malachiteum]